MILRIRFVQFRHCVRGCGYTRLETCLRVVLVELRQRVDVVTLALRLRAGLLRLLHQGQSAFQRRFIRTIPDLVPQAHCFTPVGHRTRQISLRDRLELKLRPVVPEVVQERDSRLNAVCSEASHETGKSTVPSFSPVVGCAC